MLNYAMLNYAIPYWGNVGAVFGNTPHIVQVDDFSDLFAFRLIEGPSYILAFKNQSCSSSSSISSCSIIITIIFDRQPGPHWRHGFSALSKLPAEREPTYLSIYL